jgi:hypothetical protein
MSPPTPNSMHSVTSWVRKVGLSPTCPDPAALTPGVWSFPVCTRFCPTQSLIPALLRRIKVRCPLCSNGWEKRGVSGHIRDICDPLGSYVAYVSMPLTVDVCGHEASFGYIFAQKKGSILGHIIEVLTQCLGKSWCQCVLQIFYCI